MSAAHRPGGKFAKLARKLNVSEQPASKAAAASNPPKKNPRKTIKKHPVFSDLDEAESLVLEMLSLASSTSEALSKLTQCNDITEAGEGKSDSLAKKTEADTLSDVVKSNGKDYLDKVKRIHSLLAPHSKLVVSYKPRSKRRDLQGKNTDGKPALPPVKKSNMYASRVEMRLAMERKDIMKELLRLEKQEMKIGATNDHEVNLKRKRDD